MTEITEKRLYYVDWLRVFVIATLIPYHAALTYTGLGEIYIKEIVTGFNLIPFILVTMPLDNFFMTLLFFLSGISTYYALQHRVKSEYIKERVKKLLVPLIIGTLVLCPLQAYSKALYHGFKGNYFSFIPEFFSDKIVDYLGYAHLWFLLYLFVISLICFPLFKRWIENREKYNNMINYICYKKNIYIPIIWIIVVESILRPFFPGMQIIIMDWANDILYLSVYIFGFVYASDSRIQSVIEKMFSKSIFVVFVCLICLFGVYYYWLIYNGDSIYMIFVRAFFKGVYECFMIIMLLGIGKKYFNKRSKALSYFSRASFSYYVFHLLAVTWITYFLIKTNLNEYVKYLITVILSYAFIVIFYELVRRIKSKLIHR